MRSLRALRNRAPVPFVSGRSNISLPWRQPSGTEAQLRTMETVGTVHAITSRVAPVSGRITIRIVTGPGVSLATRKVAAPGWAASPGLFGCTWVNSPSRTRRSTP